MRSWKIVSGGQTGVDRAALDAARSLGLPYGGFVPNGRRAEDGALAADYENMVETESAGYAVRTRRNVASADATLILTRGAPDRGTLLTARTAERLGKPLLVAELDDAEAVERILSWLIGLAGGTLNVAGPRESRKPGIHGQALSLLTAVLAPLRPGPAAGAPRRTG